MNMLLDLLSVKGVSGDESKISSFVFNIINERKNSWKVLPDVYFGEDFHDCILLKFGRPRTAVFAHMDTVGFMAKYENQLVAVGGPEIITDTVLVGEDSLGPIECRLKGDESKFFHDFPRGIDPGTRLSFAQNIRINDEFIQAAYLDNRLGVYNALKICENIQDGWVVFTTYEEHGGGSMPFLIKFIQETSPIKNALISDITWITDGVQPHQGVVISVRHQLIPRKIFLERIISLAKESGLSYQLEVEESGGSDAREIQFSPYAIDWCFVGAAEENVHSPDEKVSLFDFDCMIKMYAFLVKNL